MINQDFEAFCKQSHFKINEILSRRMERYVVDQRRAVAKKLRDKGYSYPQIGKVMNKDHTSIMYMVDDQHRHEKMFKMREYQKSKRMTKEVAQ